MYQKRNLHPYRHEKLAIVAVAAVAAVTAVALAVAVAVGAVILAPTRISSARPA